MKLSHYKTIVIGAAFMALLIAPTFSQSTDNTPSSPTTQESVPAPAADTAPQPKEIAIYGEVQAVNAPASTLSVQYYDYDSDSEKTADIAIDAGTKIENAAALGDIKKSDWVDVTYTMKDGKNTAKVVTVEKEEAPAPEEETAAPAASE